jgi:hypothetical protein
MGVLVQLRGTYVYRVALLSHLVVACMASERVN